MSTEVLQARFDVAAYAVSRDMRTPAFVKYAVVDWLTNEMQVNLKRVDATDINGVIADLNRIHEHFRNRNELGGTVDMQVTAVRFSNALSMTALAGGAYAAMAGAIDPAVHRMTEFTRITGIDTTGVLDNGERALLVGMIYDIVKGVN